MPSKAAIAAIRNMRDAFDKLDEGEWSKDDKKFFARKIQGFVVGAGFSSLPVAAPATATAPPAKQRSKGTVSYCNVTNSIIADMLSSKKKKKRTYKYDDKFRKAEIAAGRISDGAGNNAKSCKHWWPPTSANWSKKRLSSSLSDAISSLPSDAIPARFGFRSHVRSCAATASNVPRNRGSQLKSHKYMGAFLPDFAAAFAALLATALLLSVASEAGLAAASDGRGTDSDIGVPAAEADEGSVPYHCKSDLDKQRQNLHAWATAEVIQSRV